MITGEERIREHLGKLYGDVNGYEGHPTDYQATRTDALGRELEDVINDFHKLTDKELPVMNASLKKKKLEVIRIASEDEWKQQREGEGAPTKATTDHFREMD